MKIWEKPENHQIPAYQYISPSAGQKVTFVTVVQSHIHDQSSPQSPEYTKIYLQRPGQTQDRQAPDGEPIALPAAVDSVL